MGLMNFQFSLDKANYVPGENVTGHLIISLDSEETMKKIKVTFQGMGMVKFWALVAGNRRVFQNDETYFTMESGELYLTFKSLILQ